MIKFKTEKGREVLDMDSMIKDGWEYQDHSKMPDFVWKYILKGYGKENEDYVKLSEATYDLPEGKFMRGQLFIGPNARKNLGEYHKLVPIPKSGEEANATIH